MSQLNNLMESPKLGNNLAHSEGPSPVIVNVTNNKRNLLNVNNENYR